MQRQILSLVAKSVDVCARMLWHDDDARRAGTRFGATGRVVAVEEVIEAWRMSWMRWCSCVTRLFEIEDSGGADGSGELRAGHYSR
jgi:hypothetical protein